MGASLQVVMAEEQLQLSPEQSRQIRERRVVLVNG